MKVISRKMYADKVDSWLGKGQIIVLTGARRSGKSFVMKDFIARHKDDEGANIIYVDKEKKQFDAIITYHELNDYIDRHWADRKHNYILVDEIQEIGEWERTVRSYRTENDVDIIITGSNSTMLSGELSSILGGRNQEVFVHTLSYMEFLEFHSLPNDDSSLIKYLNIGGLPGFVLIGIDDDEHVSGYLQSVYNTIVLKDIIERHEIRNVPFLINLLKFYADNIGKINSANSIARYMKSKREDISVKVIQNYTKFYEEAYLLFTVPRYDIHGKALLESNEKVYFNDLGIRNYITRGDRKKDIEKVIENAVYLELRRIGYDVTVGILKNGEIDFVCSKGDDRLYVQASYLIASDETYEREFGSLADIRDSYPKFVISMTPGIDRSSENGIIHLSLRHFLTYGLLNLGRYSPDGNCS